MTARETYVGTPVPLDIYTAANHSRGPGGWLGYAEVTADQTGITTEVDLTGAAVSVVVGPARLLKITATVHMKESSASSEGWRVFLSEQLDGGGYTKVQSLTGMRGGNAAIQMTQTLVAVREIDSATVDYKLSAEGIFSGGNNAGSDAAADHPLTLLVEDIGPAPEA